MIDSLAKLLIDPLTERWRSAAIGGSLVFWLVLVGLALFTWPAAGRAGDVLAACHPAQAAARPLWCSLPAAGRAGAALVGGVAAVIATAFLVQALAPPFLVLMQGDGWKDSRLAWLPLKWQRHYVKKHTYRYPLKPGKLRPSRMGNSLAALEERVQEKFGYRLDVVWDVFVASLPEDAMKAVAAKSSGIHLVCQNLILSGAGFIAVIIVIPGGWPIVAAPAILALLTVCLSRAIGAATDGYCDLILTTLILHRDVLYHALGEAPPKPGENVSQRGAALSAKVEDIVR
jgi:hypothetical protein